MGLRGFLLIQGAPAKIPEVIGLILESDGEVRGRFAAAVDHKSVLEMLNTVSQHGTLSGERFLFASGECTYWEIPVRKDEQIDELWAKWSGPSRFF